MKRLPNTATMNPAPDETSASLALKRMRARIQDVIDATTTAQPIGAAVVNCLTHILAEAPVLTAESAGVVLIAAERARQMSAEGWTPEHDDRYTNDELARAAVSYATPQHHRALQLSTNGKGERVPWYWPWLSYWWKPSPKDRVRELVKAGALITAEIDRLLRARPKQQPAKPESEFARIEEAVMTHHPAAQPAARGKRQA